MIDLEKIILNVLKEENMAGGAGSAFRSWGAGYSYSVLWR
jgi:hypothetical protein